MDISDSSNKRPCSNCKKNKLCKECQRIAFPLTCKNLEKRGCRNITIKQDEFCDICKEKQKTLNDKHRQIKKIIKEENRDINDICRFCNKTLKKANKFGDNSHNECYKKDCDKNKLNLCNGWEHYGCRTILNNYSNWCEECYNKKNGYQNKNKNDDKIKCIDCETYKNDKNIFIENRCVKCYEKYVMDSGKKICSKNGCYKILNMTDKQKCEDCLTIERGKDKKRAEIKKEKKEINPNICISCGRECDELEFIGNLGKITQTCGNCRYLNKIADEKRKNDEHRKEYKKEYEKTPEVKEMRKKWRENNYDKVTKYWIEYRGKMIDSDLKGYLKRNAERMKKYRDENEEMFKEINSKRNVNDKYKIGYYKYRAEHHNIEYDIDDNIMIELFHEPCVYCAEEINDKKLNGVDRINNDLGYIESNVASCCEMCNYMKRCMDSYIFIKKCEHILTYNNIINGKLYDDFFENHFDIKIEKYRDRAKNKNMDFDLSKDEFNLLINNDCYICGKKTNDKHKNGIDRYDNKKGYIIENCRTCCGDCNYMKREYDYGIFMNKIIDIYNNTNISNSKNNDNDNDNNNEDEDNDNDDNDNNYIDDKNNDDDNKNNGVIVNNNNENNASDIDEDSIDENDINDNTSCKIKIQKKNTNKINFMGEKLEDLYKIKNIYETEFDNLRLFKGEVNISDEDIEIKKSLEKKIKENMTIYERIRKSKKDLTYIQTIQNLLKEDKQKYKKYSQMDNIFQYKEEYRIMLLLKINIKIEIIELENKKKQINLQNFDLQNKINELRKKYDDLHTEIFQFLRKREIIKLFNAEATMLNIYYDNNKTKKENKTEKLINKYTINKDETLQNLIDKRNQK